MPRKLVFGCVYPKDSEPSELELWRDKTPLQRLAAIEELRTQVHGAPIRVARVGCVRKMRPEKTP